MDVIRCLLVDDDLDDREIFGLALSEVEPAVEIRWARDGVEALDQLTTGTWIPHFIFLDLNMPRMGGAECLREIKKIPALLESRVVIYSTSAERRYIEEASAAGAALFLKKPSTIVALVRMLENVFEGTVKSFFYEDGHSNKL